VRYLPTYSPDLNPIEQAFSKLKMALRGVAARHFEGASQARRKIKPKIAKVEGVYEGVDHANRIALVKPVIEAFRQQRQLCPIHPRYEARHPCPPPNQRRINAES
jgi:hypothetical protein